MANYAVMSGASVLNVIVAESKEDAEIATGAECIEYKETEGVGIGYTYNRVESKFMSPAEMQSPVETSTE